MIKRIVVLHPIAGFLAGIIYLSFTLLAYSHYPGMYTPLTHWLSDLGDVRQNPQGAAFYNLGISLAALLLMLFFLGFSHWQLEKSRIQAWMVRLTQIFGVLGSLAMLMSAIFPINHIAQHRFWSISLYILLGTAFVFSVAALRYRQDVPKWVLSLGILVAACDMLSGIYHEVTFLEWITVALLLIYVILVSILAFPVPGQVVRRTR